MEAIVLAGGQSTRFGCDKAWEPVGGEPLLTRVVRRLAEVSQAIVVVGSARPLPPLAPVARVVGDDLPGWGPLGGIWTGLRHIRGERAFVAACDMPYVNPALAKALFQLGALVPVVLPLVQGRPEPLHAVYSKRCLPVFLSHLAAGDRALQTVMEGAGTLLVGEAELRSLDPALLSFFNLNTARDLEIAERLAGARHLDEAVV